MSGIVNSLKTFVEKKYPAKPKISTQHITADNIDYYKTESEEIIRQRISELNDEWDVERSAELNGAIGILTGLLLAATAGKKWLLLPAAISGFFAWHALTGKKLPPLANKGLRTRKQIAQEQCGLEEILRSNTRRYDY